MEVQKKPEILFRDGNEIFYIEKEANEVLKQKVSLNAENLYESQGSLTISDDAVTVHKDYHQNMVRTTKGELFLGK